MRIVRQGHSCRVFPDEEGTERRLRTSATRGSVSSCRVFPDEEGTERRLRTSATRGSVSSCRVFPDEEGTESWIEQAVHNATFTALQSIPR